MEINEDHIAELEGLAKISLAPEEKDKIKSELSVMLRHMEVLNELDVDDVEPLSHTQNGAVTLRADEPRESLPAEALLVNAPEKDGSFFAVPKAFE